MYDVVGKGYLLQLTEVEGLPRKGAMLGMGSDTCRVIEVLRNSTDGRAVSDRSCLTGRPVSPYGAVLVEWIGDVPLPKDVFGRWVKEEAR